jgi:hypothetical protein
MNKFLAFPWCSKTPINMRQALPFILPYDKWKERLTSTFYTHPLSSSSSLLSLQVTLSLWLSLGQTAAIQHLLLYFFYQKTEEKKLPLSTLLARPVPRKIERKPKTLTDKNWAITNSDWVEPKWESVCLEVFYLSSNFHVNRRIFYHREVGRSKLPSIWTKILKSNRW